MTIDALEAESAVCGSILLDDACLPEVLEHLTEADFVLEANRAIFRAAVELYRREEPVDPVSIRAEARVQSATLHDGADAGHQHSGQ